MGRVCGFDQEPCFVSPMSCMHVLSSLPTSREVPVYKSHRIAVAFLSGIARTEEGTSGEEDWSMAGGMFPSTRSLFRRSSCSVGT